MSNEELQIIIAEKHGWKWKKALNCESHAWFDNEGIGRGWWNIDLYTKEQAANRDLPKYTLDLNAMHEVETDYIIPNGLWDDYVAVLKTLMRDGERFWGQATARQRSIAFVKLFEKLKLLGVSQ